MSTELGPLAKQEWDRLVGELATLRLLTNLDRAALAAYCGAYALWAESTAQIQKYGAMIKSPTGFPIQSPYLAIANRQAEIMMRIASEFGFTPASRKSDRHARQGGSIAIRFDGGRARRTFG
jgi:P27 family predicted phage terminase small subunit